MRSNGVYYLSTEKFFARPFLYTLIFIQEGYIQEGQPQFGQKIKKVIYMMTSLLLNKGLRLNSVSNLLINKKECILLRGGTTFLDCALVANILLSIAQLF